MFGSGNSTVSNLVSGKSDQAAIINAVLKNYADRMAESRFEEIQQAYEALISSTSRNASP